ncbi:sigma-70 region 4 domain-containing protein [Streptomyces sp. NPDC051909]|uniref:sigma-70 region 4 domain-containing protein n=1 Tax=Streptomyces sp. NPDC051909 TaxID=3154944 RepID=UPI003436BF77
MREIETGGQDTVILGTAGGQHELSAEIQRDVDRVAAVVTAGFRGRDWKQLADELYLYAYKTLHTAMRDSYKLMQLVASSPTPLVLSTDERSALHSNFEDRAVIATMTISEAMSTLPNSLRKGGYNPAANPGKSGKHKSLASFFVGRCGLVFPRVFYGWRRERTDRFVAAANEHMRGWIISGVLRQTAEESAFLEDSVPDEVTKLYSTLTDMIADLKPRNRAVWRMTLEGYSRGEIAEELGIKLGDVDNALYTFRTRVKALRRDGKLPVPPTVEAEWERSRQLDAATNGAAR